MNTQPHTPASRNEEAVALRDAIRSAEISHSGMTYGDEKSGGESEYARGWGDCLKAIKDAAPDDSAGAGWKLVPPVPTAAMVSAAAEAPEADDAKQDIENMWRAMLLAAPGAATGGQFQQRVRPWLLACFGEQIANAREERNHRFLEEALELVQACGCTANEAHQLVDYTFGRPVGEKAQEVGGVMVTLAALCLAQGIDMHAEGETELARIWTMVEKIRAKQAAKPKHSPLPAALASRPEAPPASASLATVAQPVAEHQLAVLNDDLIAILGRPNFTCIRLAQALRLCGVEIKTKAEHEQAAVIHFLLTRYLRHGSEWATHSDADLRAMLDQVEAKNKAVMGAPLETGEGSAR